MAGLDGGEPAVSITVVDITADHGERERLRHAATHDPMTGAANRPLFLEATRHAWLDCPAIRAGWA